MIFTWPLLAQDSDFVFKNYTEKDGLCDNLTFSMVKDKNNILWIGTQTGLSRFDGKHFYNFKQIHENGVYVSNTVASLCTDTKGNVWGGTHNGIFRFNPSIGKFHVYFPFEDKRDNFIPAILSDSKGNVYVSGRGGILKYNAAINQFEIWKNFTNDQNDPLSKVRPWKNNFILDEENHCFWFGISSGLVKFDYHKNEITRPSNNSQIPLFQKRVISAMTKAPTGLIWFYDNTNQKVVCFDPRNKKEVKNIPTGKSKFINHAVTTLVDSDERIWISNWDYKLILIDQKNGNQITQINSSGLSNNIGSTFIWNAFEDENHSLWFGTLNGISSFNSNPQVYNGEKIRNVIPLLDSARLRGVEEDPIDKSWWLMTYSSNFFQYFPKERRYKNYKLSEFGKNNEGEKPQSVSQIIFGNQAVFALTNKGIWVKNKESKKFIHYDFGYDKEVFNVTYAEFSYPFWYLSDESKILKFNVETRAINWIVDSILIKNKVHKIFPKKNGSFEAITFYNYLVYSYIDGKTNVDSSFYKVLSNSVGYLADAEMDTLGRIWISCKGVGLFMSDSKNHIFRSWTDKDGMADKDLHHIALDKKGNIWGVYWNKMLVYNPLKNNFINFKIPYSEHKLDYDNYLTTKSDGIVMTIIGDDIFELHSNHLNQQPKQIKPSFSMVSFSGKEYFDTDNGEINLAPQQNHLRIKYGLLVDPVLFPHTYEYILEGAETIWNQTSVASEITYSNLPSGKYEFKIRAVNKNTNWNSDMKTLQFVIATPLYKRTWFLALSSLAILFGIRAYYTSRMKIRENLIQLESKTHHLEKEKAQMMFDSLKQQLNPHFLFNSLTSLSELIHADQNLAGKFLSQMSDMYRYILKNGDSELVSLNDEISFVQTYYNLQKTRFGDGLKLNIAVETDINKYQIAPVTLQNMIENAIKHNIIDADEPLVIDIFLEDEYIIVRNNNQPKRNVETSNKRGLTQFKSLYKYLTPDPIIISHTDQYFLIKIPLIKKS